MDDLNVLVVEDELIVAKDLTMQLTSMGCQIAGTVLSGEEALEIIDKRTPDLILMDIHLKGELTGIQTAEKILKKLSVPIIFITAYSDNNTLDKVKNIGAASFMHKPISRKQLETNIKIALYQHEMDAKLKQQSLILKSRLNELNCLYEISKVFVTPDLSLDERYQNLVELIANAGIHPDVTGAQLNLDEKSFKTGKCDASLSIMSVEIHLNKDVFGNIKLFYTNPEHKNESDIFLHDEKKFLHEIADRLSQFEQQRKIEESLHIRDRALASSLNAIVLTDLDGVITYINDSFCNLWNIEPEKAIGESSEKFWDLKGSSLTSESQSSTGGMHWRGEIVAKKNDGKTFYAEMSSSMVGDENGQPLCIMSSFVDVTQRRQAENEIKHRITQAKLIYEIGQDLSGELKLDMLLNKIVSDVRDAFGFDGVMLMFRDDHSDEFHLKAITGTYVDVFPKDLTLKIGEGMIGTAAQTGESQITGDVTQDPNFVRKANEGTLSEMAIPIKSRKGIIGILDIQSDERDAFRQSDVSAMETLSTQIAVAIENANLFTQAKSEIAERKEKEKEIRIAHGELDQIFNIAADGIRVIDKNFNVLKINKTLLNILNKSEDDVVGKKCYNSLYCQFCHTMNCPMFKVNSKNQRVETELTWKTKDGTQLTSILTATPFRSTDGQLIGMIEHIKDITDRKKLETQLVQAQKLESIGQLAAGIAHEINTPTQYVGDNTRFIQDSFQDLSKVFTKLNECINDATDGQASPEKFIELKNSVKEADLEYLAEEVPLAIQQSLEGIDRITHIVRAMKDFSHPGQVDKTSVDINRAIETTMTVARNEWKYVADIETDFDPNLPTVQCHPTEINQVFLNFITNAAHAIGESSKDSGEGKGLIKITTTQDNGSVVIQIKDSGPGVPDKIREKIFDPFFTTKEVGKGTGQGLAISHSVIVEKHGGSIDLAPSDEKGATFIIKLPITG